MKLIKNIFFSTLIITAGIGLTGCDIGVLELDIGMGFEAGEYEMTSGG